MNSRGHAVKVLAAILQHGISLSAALPQQLATEKIPDAALVQAISYGVLRHYYQLEFTLKQLLVKPLKDKDYDINLLLLIGLFQLQFLSIPPAIVLNETVNAAKQLRKLWGAGLVNGVLRQYLRQASELKAASEDLVVQYNHPLWLIRQLQLAWPHDWQTILRNNQQKPPMTLRVNPLQTTREQYQQLLKTAQIESEVLQPDSALILYQAVSVEKLPHFYEGYVSVQDAASQIAALLLDCPAQARVLDACAAPGGKTCHLLERYPAIKNLVALDIAGDRVGKIEENLKRLQLSAELIINDATKTNEWWDGNLFDRILCDAPCSATGVIRRHPDIKFLRQETDIATLAQQQLALLTALWPLLKSGGKLLYTTCSVLPQENSGVIAQFLQQENTASLVNFNIEDGNTLMYGQQILPGSLNRDGFYFCLLTKIP